MKYYFLLFALLLMGCDDRKIDASKWKEEMKTKKFIKVTDGEIASDADNYAKEVLNDLDSLSGLSNSMTIDSIILLEEAKFKKTIKVKVCFVKQDGLDGCYAPITSLITEKDTINKVKETWEAYENAVKEKVAITNAPQFLLDGFYILYAQPIIKDDALVAMWCLLFERKNIVLNRIE